MTDKLPTGMTRDARSGILYLRHRIPQPLIPAFSVGQFYKVSLETRDLSEARSRFAIANGKFEAKCKAFREALANAGQGSLSSEEAEGLLIVRDQREEIAVLGSSTPPAIAWVNARATYQCMDEIDGGLDPDAPENVEGEPVEEARLALPKALIKWLLRTKPAAKPVPKVIPPPKNWRSPIHGPQAPPTSIPQGWRVREVGPNSNYPNGYWCLEKPVGNGGWRGINPSTGKPGPQWETHIPFL